MEKDLLIQIQTEDVLNKSDFETVRQNLILFNENKVGQENYEQIFLTAKTAHNNLVGGLIASIFWDTLHIEIIWTDNNYRNKGIASRLLTEVEKISFSKGCYLALLDTFDFQAPDFYLKRGYLQVGQIDDYPKGHTKYYYSKKLVLNKT